MVSGGSELTGHGSRLAELTNPSPEATLPPAKPSPVWLHGPKCLSQRDSSSEVHQGRERSQVQGSGPRARSQESPLPGEPTPRPSLPSPCVDKRKKLECRK